MKRIINKLCARFRLLKSIRCNDQLMILNYHRMRSPNKKIIFDEGVYGPDAGRFQQEMEWLRKETRIISEDELIEVLYHKKKFNTLCSMVTLDDGYIDNYDIAFPILKKLSIPAIYFIPTKNINDRTLGWWDIVAYLVKNTQLRKTRFRGTPLFFNDKKKVIAELILELREIETSRVDSYLEELSACLGVRIPSLEIQGRELMTWEQIKEVSESGISIGSHTHDHVILSRQPLGDLRSQVKKSKDILEEKLGKNIQSLAYPMGGYEHFDIETKEITQSLGFKLGFSFLTGANHFNHIDPFDVKRGTSRADWINLDIPLAFPDRTFQQKRPVRFQRI